MSKAFDFSKELSEAKNFLSRQSVDTSSVRLDVVLLSEGNEVVLFRNEEYFVLVAAKEYADNLDSPILVYSLERGFTEDELVYDNLFLFYEYIPQLRTLKENGVSGKGDSGCCSNEDAVSPLLGRIAWGDGIPYNKFCPSSSVAPKMKTKVGSLGVAMSQIMMYYKYPSVGRGKFAYDAGMQGSIDFEKINCDWENMLDVYDADITDEKVNSVAKLMVAASVSVGTKFDYTKSLSSTALLRLALVNHFGFSPQCVLLDNLSSEELLAHAYQELGANRPFIYTVYTSEYGTHSLVCDGFDKDYLHFNMGLSGVANGYYKQLFHVGSPNSLSSVLIGIEPDKNMDYTKEVVVKKPGMLSQLLSDEEKANLRKLTIKGKLNNKDMNLLRWMAGAEKQKGNLMELDLYDAKFVTDRDSCFHRKSAREYKAWATKTTYRVTTNKTGYYSKIPVKTRAYYFDFSGMDEKEWKEFCSLGLNKKDGFFFSKDGDEYYINYHTQKRIVGDEMFINCMNLRRIVLPKKTKSVGESVFDNCYLLEDVSYNEKVTELESSTFKKNYSYGESVKKIYPTDVYLGRAVERSKIVLNDDGTKGWSILLKDISIVDSVIDISNELEQEEEIFQVVENQPEFPGGMAELMKYLEENIKYPKVCEEQGVEGRVIVQFVVNTDGSLSNIEVIKLVHPDLSKEAVRLVSEMPKWIPGKQRGRSVRVRFTIPITFKLPDESGKAKE